MTLEVKVRTAAAANVALQGFLGTNPFRWYDIQLDQKQKTFPQVAAQGVSTIPTTAINNPIGNLSRNRFQIRAYANDSSAGETSRALAEAIKDFMRTFSATYGTQYANILLNQMGAIEKPEVQPPVFVQLLEFQIFNREDL